MTGTGSLSTEFVIINSNDLLISRDGTMLLKSSMKGFTLIELTIVIAIIGILVAVAIPKFISLSSNADSAATNAVAGALSAANSSNHEARNLNSSLGNAITNCTDVATSLQGGLPSGYTIIAHAVNVGETITCTVNGPDLTTATFTATGIS